MNNEASINNKEKPNFFRNPVVITVCALICCALWGSATPFIKIGYELLTPERNIPSTILFAGIRFTLAGVLTIVFYSIARRKLLLPKKKNLKYIGIVSLFQTVIQYIFFYIGLSNTSGVKGTVASGSSAFFSVLIAGLIFKQEKLTAKKIIACLLGFSGIVLINLNGIEFTMNFLGDGFVILSTVSYALSSVLIKTFSKYEDPVIISGYQFMLGGAVMSIVGLLFGGKVVISSPRSALVLLYLAFLSAVAYALWGILLKHNPVSRISIFSFTTPIFGTILSTLLLTEDSKTSPAILVIVLLLVSSGILLLNLDMPKRKKKT